MSERKLHRNDFTSLAKLRDRLLRFQDHYEVVAKPFQWKFERRDLDRFLSKLENHATSLQVREAA